MQKQTVIASDRYEKTSENSDVAYFQKQPALHHLQTKFEENMVNASVQKPSTNQITAN